MGCSESSDARPSDRRRTLGERRIQWEKLRQLLPREKTAEGKEKRENLWLKFDPEQTGKITYSAVCDKAEAVIQLQNFTKKWRTLIRRAFDRASARSRRGSFLGPSSDVTIQYSEFRLLICYIYDYFEVEVMFDQMDFSDDGMVSREEFTRAVPFLDRWGVRIDYPDEVFDEIDQSGDGKISFLEFAHWAAAKKLDVDGDPDSMVS